MMKYFVDGDQLCIVNDDFVDLQESPAVFIPLKGPVVADSADLAKLKTFERQLVVTQKELFDLAVAFNDLPEGLRKHIVLPVT